MAEICGDTVAHVRQVEQASCGEVQLDYSPSKQKTIPKKPEGLRQIRDHVRKALGDDNPNLLCTLLHGKGGPKSRRQHKKPALLVNNYQKSRKRS